MVGPRRRYLAHRRCARLDGDDDQGRDRAGGTLALAALTMVACTCTNAAACPSTASLLPPWPFAAPFHCVCVSLRPLALQVVKFFEETGAAKSRLIIYNCTSGYPVPFPDICMLEINRCLRHRHRRRRHFHHH